MLEVTCISFWLPFLSVYHYIAARPPHNNKTDQSNATPNNMDGFYQPKAKQKKSSQKQKTKTFCLASVTGKHKRCLQKSEQGSHLRWECVKIGVRHEERSAGTGKFSFLSWLLGYPGCSLCKNTSHLCSDLCTFLYVCYPSIKKYIS